MNNYLEADKIGFSPFGRVGGPNCVYLLHTEGYGIYSLFALLDNSCVISGIDGSTKYIRYTVYTTYTDSMLGKDSWYSEPDNARKPYVIVTVKTRAGNVVSCQICHANSVKIVEIKHVSESDERETLKKLIGEVRSCESNTILITHTSKILPLFRLKILQHHLTASFRGLQHLCVQDLLEQYFAGDNRAFQADRDAKSVWELFKRIAPLLPRNALKGEML